MRLKFFRRDKIRKKTKVCPEAIFYGNLKLDIKSGMK